MIRIAICGFGNIGRVHLSNLRSLRGCEVAGVYDAQPLVREAASKQHHVRVYGSEFELWDDRSWTALVIATPADAHHDWTLAALEQGRHVFIEKPLASDLKQSEAIAAAVRRYPDCCVQVGFCERFNPQYMEAKRAISEGTLGQLRSIDSSRVTPLELSDPTWPLGVLDTAVHNLDLILMLFNKMPLAVRASGAQIYSDLPGRHTVTTLLTFPDGTLATDRVTWLRGPLHPLRHCARSRMSIYGTDGAFDIDLAERPSSLMTKDRFQMIDTVILGGSDYYGCLKLQFEAFLRSIEAGLPPAVTVESALNTERVALAAAESLKTGQDAWL